MHSYFTSTYLFCLLAMYSLLQGCQPQPPQPTPPDAPPAWAAEAIWYQIFVERFNNGDSTNDPTAASIAIPPLNVQAPAGWAPTPWGQDWYTRDAWANPDQPFHQTLQYRRYGGDLQGVLDKLDYLQDLGITALYLNPINAAPSLHKYDASSYHHVDPHFGPDPEGDKALMAAENPGDPATWAWTAADKLFLQLVSEVHRRGMKIIVDFSWNHTGTLFWAWQDILKKGSASPYKDWYMIKQFDDPATPANEMEYDGWLNIASLPELRKVNVTTERRIGYPYEGDIHPAVKQHIYDVTRRWLAPDGDSTQGIDGYRLDVADHIGMVFWRDWRRHVRSIQPNAYLVGEIWWQRWPDELMDPVPYTSGDVFDAVMFYQAYRPAKYFFSQSDYAIDAAQLKDSLQKEWNRLLPANRHAMMNVSSTHDAPRLLTCFANKGKYKYHALPHEDPAYLTGMPTDDTYQRVRLYLVHLFTIPGAPQIWNGEEMGMWGGDDPDCRKPLWWKELSFQPETATNFQPGTKYYDKVHFNEQQHAWYKNLIRIRKANPILSHGDISFLQATGQQLAYQRGTGAEALYIYFNTGTETATFDLPAKGVYNNLISNAEVKGAQVTIAPLEAAILKKL